LQSARNLTPDTRGTIDILELDRVTLQDDVMHEVCRQLAPYRADEKPITGRTVIYDDLSIDSLAVMDIVVELEDRFDVAIPINVVAEIRTVEELVDAILTLHART
jgi:acyl carrier protein